MNVDIVSKANYIIAKHPDVFLEARYCMANKMFLIKFWSGASRYISPSAIIQMYEGKGSINDVYEEQKLDIDNELDRYNFYMKHGELEKAKWIIKTLKGCEDGDVER